VGVARQIHHTVNIHVIKKSYAKYSNKFKPLIVEPEASTKPPWSSKPLGGVFSLGDVATDAAGL
jgi:hypothetical protein